jgi:hypothetical protein
MSYALSFAPEFFWSDDCVENMKPSDRPTSVRQALLSLTDDKWASLARDLFGIDSNDLELDTVMQQVMETNTCRNLDTPVEVFVDQEGIYSVLVY